VYIHSQDLAKKSVSAGSRKQQPGALCSPEQKEIWILVDENSE